MNVNVTCASVSRYMSIAVVNGDPATAVVALACSDGAIRSVLPQETKS